MKWPVAIDTPACSQYVLRAIDHAHALEGIGPLVLPRNWRSLSVPEQLFVVLDLERVTRGLPPYVGINATLSGTAEAAARGRRDPAAATGFLVAIDPRGYKAMGGAWSSGFSVLAADYTWMYNDGWSGSKATTSNISCTAATASACWAHREELLGSDPTFNPGVGLGCSNCEVGTGYSVVDGQSSYVDLIEKPRSAAPPMTFTWAKNVLPYL